jgi:hypothetical protein
MPRLLPDLIEARNTGSASLDMSSICSLLFLAGVSGDPTLFSQAI